MSRKLCPDPIFVMGTPRSGTTLTARILNEHSKIFMPGEVHFFEDIYSRWADAGDHALESSRQQIVERLYTIFQRYYEEEDQKRIDKMFRDKEELSESIGEIHNFGQLLDSFIAIQMEADGKTRWGNNVPRDLFHVEDISRFWPRAKAIICVRDPRDFLLSYKERWRVTGQTHRARIKSLYHPIVTSFLWKASVRRAKQICEDGTLDYVLLRYEDLVKRPEEEVRKVCFSIEEEFEPKMLRVAVHNSSVAGEKKGIFQSSVDRWKSHLSQEEIFLVQRIGEKEMRWLGYEPDDAKVNWFRLAGIVLQTPIALWRSLSANRDIRGPLLPYLVRRLRPLTKSNF